ncbi:MAG TPA: nucleotidyltransferase domain-containing protein, partial [Polyangiaceae bacterium LLY-WYZ-15_(1-7)]|nr:nucleotidyltransferase domain-containing protein [Polyangiaceae bacterium LLY-WYZ-15_(1-7)]
MQQAPQQPSIDLSRLAPGLGDCCGEYLQDYREDFAAAIRRGEKGVEAAQRYARALDGLLGALYCAADAAARRQKDGGGRVALVAVGGYGRGTVGLHSDVDVLFLCDDPTDRRVRSLAEGLLYPLWDLGVDIGHAVRGVDETLALAREDIRTATTLIDLRRVAGDASIVTDLERGARRQIFEPRLDAFLDALLEDTERRHERFGGSLYLLEPEVKQGRGGLRDLDVAEWAARARWGASCTEDYVRTGALLAREVEELEAARELLWRVRNLLHLRAGRQQDRLTFADQEEIAVELGFVDGITLAVEQFMQAYYRHARVVAQTAERMLARARPESPKKKPPMRDLGDGTALFAQHVTLASTDRLAEDPALAFRFYRQVLRRQLPPYAFARDAIARIAVEPGWRERLQA